MDIQYIRHPEAPESWPPLAARAGDFVFAGGFMAAHPVKGMPPETRLSPGLPWHGSVIERQVRIVFGDMQSSLQQMGSSLSQIMKINSYHTKPEEIDMALRVRREFLGTEAPPPSTLVLAPELPVHGPTVVMDVTSLVSTAALSRQPVVATRMPAAIHVAAMGFAPYIYAVSGGGFVFTAGRAASRAGGPIEESLPHPEFPYRFHQICLQTEHVMNALKGVLADAGCSLEDVVRAEVHLAETRDLAGLDEVWRRFFPKDPPARVVVPLHPPSACIVEIELIAVDPRGPYRKQVIATGQAPVPLGHEAQAVRAGPLLFLSGQVATDYKRGVPPEARPDPNFPYHSSPVTRQVEYIYKNVEAICRAGGTSSANLVRRRAAHLDLGDMPEAEEVWQSRLGERLPPTTFLRVNSPLIVPGCLVQYDLIAAVPG
ncbi:MAG: RidA family protein [Chloroflexi bacterium]|nr:RidA family protein [Chloroflexota bacterium]